MAPWQPEPSTRVSLALTPQQPPGTAPLSQAVMSFILCPLLSLFCFVLTQSDLQANSPHGHTRNPTQPKCQDKAAHEASLRGALISISSWDSWSKVPGAFHRPWKLLGREFQEPPYWSHSLWTPGNIQEWGCLSYFSDLFGQSETWGTSPGGLIWPIFTLVTHPSRVPNCNQGHMLSLSVGEYKRVSFGRPQAVTVIQLLVQIWPEYILDNGHCQPEFGTVKFQYLNWFR